MGKHSKPESSGHNTKPFNPNASPEQKAKEFDDQVDQNGGDSNITKRPFDYGDD